MALRQKWYLCGMAIDGGGPGEWSREVCSPDAMILGLLVNAELMKKQGQLSKVVAFVEGAQATSKADAHLRQPANRNAPMTCSK
jgi:hypothetical protein